MAFRSKIETWFGEGADALHRVLPQAPRGYGCPICFGLFTSYDLNGRQLTFDHAPPESQGGREVALTCVTCNNSAGTVMESQMKKQEVLYDFAQGVLDSPTHVRIKSGELRIGADFTAVGQGMVVRVIPKQNNPRVLETYQASMGAAVDAGSNGGPFGIEFEAFHHRRATIGWLKAGYLVAFAALGYRYILRNALRRVQEQLRDPDSVTLRVFSVSDPAAPKELRSLLLIREPDWLRSLAVRMGRHTVLLPWEDDEIYERLTERASHENALRAEIGDALEIPWPERPMWRLDVA